MHLSAAGPALHPAGSTLHLGEVLPLHSGGRRQTPGKGSTSALWQASDDCLCPYRRTGGISPVPALRDEPRSRRACSHAETALWRPQTSNAQREMEAAQPDRTGKTESSCSIFTQERRPMAIYHLSIKIGKRHGSKSSVAAAAYRAGVRLKDERSGKIYDYTHKKEVTYSEIILPENAPSFFRDREKLWNSVEQTEKQDNAQLFREFEIALPRELSGDHQIQAAHEFFRRRADEGMIVDWSFHDKDGNPHVHGIAPTRGVKKDGGWTQKTKQVYALDQKGERIPVIDPKTGQQKIGARGRKIWKRETVEANNWNDRSRAKEWRAEWAEICNRYLAMERQPERIDDRSYEEQGIDKVATKHEGYAARQIEARGGVSSVAEQNRQIRLLNRMLEKAKKMGVQLIRQFEQLKESVRKEFENIDELRAGNDILSTGRRDGESHDRTAGTAEESGRQAEGHDGRIQPVSDEDRGSGSGEQGTQIPASEIPEEILRRLKEMKSQSESQNREIQETLKKGESLSERFSRWVQHRAAYESARAASERDRGKGPDHSDASEAVRNEGCGNPLSPGTEAEGRNRRMEDFPGTGAESPETPGMRGRGEEPENSVKRPRGRSL